MDRVNKYWKRESAMRGPNLCRAMLRPAQKNEKEIPISGC